MKKSTKETVAIFFLLAALALGIIGALISNPAILFFPCICIAYWFKSYISRRLTRKGIA